ncbi:MAG: AmmeMemoRadiSam system protein B [Spirochaetaceae bacterium]|jgi:AmmeMemoRadiSam system protein B|nr:AmmeMemoRadiSam system protein B [Spirochaetaceae bacterium]
MNLRKQILSAGWYPHSAEKARRFLEQCSLEQRSPEQNPKGAVAVIAPHAGWHYSGCIASRAFQVLKTGVDTVIVIGGHLSAGTPPLFAEEDGVVTPLGSLEIDQEFRDRIWKELGGKPDRYFDNTVEVLLPMVKFYFPRSRLIWMRLGAEIQSYAVGKIITGIGASLERRFLLIGSSDLTHYGLNYDYAPQGTGRKALEWMKTVNDAAFIQAVMSGDEIETLRRAEVDRSSCSAGAVLACMGYAHSLAASEAELLSYGTSVDSGETSFEGAARFRAALGGGSSGEDVSSGADDIPDSFVGYAAMAWYPGGEGGSF